MNVFNTAIPLWVVLLVISISAYINYLVVTIKWSKVRGGKKPIGWWYHKIMCELWYYYKKTGKYYKHLNKMCDKYNINLYGDKINRPT